MQKVKRKPLSVNPKTLLLYGPPKIGKTTMLSNLDDCLIVDTEQGSSMIEGYIHEVNDRKELIDFISDLSSDNPYKYVAIDTIDKVADWAEKRVCEENEVTALADLSFGKGWALHREKVMSTLKFLKLASPHLIIVGHRKIARAVLEGQQMVEPESLELTGRLKNMIMSDCDAIGYVYREAETEKLRVSFKGNGALEAGSRCPHLKGQDIEFNWNLIYKKETK